MASDSLTGPRSLLESLPPIRQPASLPGQLDLLGKRYLLPRVESEIPEGAKCMRKCNRCGDLDQSVPHVVYDPTEAGCPVCHCQEFSTAIEEPHEMSAAASVQSPPKKARTKSNQVSKAHQDPTGTSVDQDAQVMGELLEVELDLIQPSPDNPRKNFAEKPLQELAASIASIGLLQPLLVARCGGIFELIAGNRRYIAAQGAGVRTVPCYVRDLTQEQITVARLAENLKREDLNAIEEARGYQAAMERHGWSQADLVRQTGVSQGQISNRLRLLTLPNEWQEMVISCEMTPSQARDITPFAKFPEFFTQLAKKLGKSKPANISPAAFSQDVDHAVYQSSEAISGRSEFQSAWVNYDFRKLDAETLDRLQVVKFRNHWGREDERCFNVKLWKELLEVAHKKQVEKEAKQRAKIDAHKASKKSEPKSEAALAQQAEQHAKRIYRYKIAWLQSVIREITHMLSAEDVMQFAIGFMLIDGKPRRRLMTMAAMDLEIKCPFEDEFYVSDTEAWKWICGLDKSQMAELLKLYVAYLCTIPAKSYGCDANPILIEHLAQLLKIRLDDHWRVSQEFLELHRIDQLNDLMGEWILPPKNGTKSVLISHILLQDERKQLKAPKELRTVKPCQLD